MPNYRVGFAVEQEGEMVVEAKDKSEAARKVNRILMQIRSERFSKEKTYYSIDYYLTDDMSSIYPTCVDETDEEVDTEEES